MKPLAALHKSVYDEKYLRLSKNRGKYVIAVAKNKNTIELNGKRYDAVTGALLAGSHEPAAKNPHHAATVHVAHPAKKPAPHSHQAAPAPKATGQFMDIRRTPATHLKHHRPEGSKTLMRKVVIRPEPSIKRHVKSVTPTTTVSKVPAHAVALKASVGYIEPSRLKRAEHIQRNSLVSRFGAAPAPTAHHATHAAHQLKHDVDVAIASVSGEISQIRPVFAAESAAARPSMDIFEQALARASSHKETYINPKKARRAAKRGGRSGSKRLLRSGSLALAVLLVAGFIAYQNTANITMRIASSKAGFHASMPGFKPSGFAATKFSYGAGTVAVNFHSNSDDRAFNITQKVSNWDSTALLNEFVSNAKGDSYQTLEASGRTIYTYGDNNATWVDHGVWFNVVSNGSLSTTQLVNLATSM